MVSGWRGAVAFLTPVGGAAAPDPRSLAWFPLVGAAVGAAVGGVWWLACQVWPPGVAAALAVVADLAITGMLHIDGLCDSADGLLAPMTRARRLEVMAAPDVGAFGVAVCAVVLLVRWVSLASLHPSVWLVMAVCCLSRGAMAVVALAVPYARPGGLATAFRGDTLHPVVIGLVGVVGAVALAVLWKPLAGVAAVGAVLIGAGLVIALAWRRIGGFTGDVLGALGVVGETAGLMVAAAKW
jgi:adenosylcobinamide-GDP ribazoletransferase